MEELALMHQLMDIFQYKNEFQHLSSNLAPQDMYVLERIYFQHAVTAIELSKKYHIPSSTLTGILGRLLQKHFITKNIRDDRRAFELHLTPEGMNMVTLHLKEDQLFTRNFFNSLDSSKKLQLTKLLEELLKNLEKENLFMQNDFDIN